MRATISLIKGDGIGVDVSDAAMFLAQKAMSKWVKVVRAQMMISNSKTLLWPIILLIPIGMIQMLITLTTFYNFRTKENIYNQMLAHSVQLKLMKEIKLNFKK